MGPAGVPASCCELESPTRRLTAPGAFPAHFRGSPLSLWFLLSLFRTRIYGLILKVSFTCFHPSVLTRLEAGERALFQKTPPKTYDDPPVPFQKSFFLVVEPGIHPPGAAGTVDKD
ncbi:hypothetical protein NE237_001605 [Protea cynaroides]|uniref:Uncharacterized protein n=1 Tax=Protea cynaroides TaxID=273540 RepID=A0A9Q0QYL2_9MAGN|nr:hypothetical protein NE237_001605 [Protea cynaroides]